MSAKLCPRSVAATLCVDSGENGKNIVLDFNKSKTWKWICNVRNGRVAEGGGEGGGGWVVRQRRYII